jgi:LmbE family N-acetylglucosaminyl deacetylase
MKIIVIGAHPDDYEVGMGGTIHKHVSEGDEVYGIVVTDGEGIGKPEVRKNEAKKAAEVLGIKKVFFLGFPDRKVEYNHDVISKIEDIINEIKPTRVYTHFNGDVHQDHRAISLSTLTAARKVKQLIFYESPTSQINFSPNFFVKFKDVTKKIEAIKAHSSVYDVSKRYFEINCIESVANFRGYQCNTEYAEAFKIFRYMEEEKGINENDS